MLFSTKKISTKRVLITAPRNNDFHSFYVDYIYIIYINVNNSIFRNIYKIFCFGKIMSNYKIVLEASTHDERCFRKLSSQSVFG